MIEVMTSSIVSLGLVGRGNRRPLCAVVVPIPRLLRSSSDKEAMGEKGLKTESNSCYSSGHGTFNGSLTSIFDLVFISTRVH